MTETLSHIALKDLTAGADFYAALPGVTISTDERGCMVVEAPGLIEHPLITNDLIDQKNGKEFRWLGRIDRQINSGGVKISAEILEKKCEGFLSRYCDSESFFFDWQLDELLGQRVVMVISGKEEFSAEMTADLAEGLKSRLGKFEIPKAIYLTSKILVTPGGKPDRKATLKSAVQIWP
jgi:O-succinylbenzoic acid--CoA ligase